MGPEQTSDIGETRWRIVAPSHALLAPVTSLCVAIALTATAAAQTPQELLPQPPAPQAEQSRRPDDAIANAAPAAPQRPVAVVSWHLEDADEAGAVDIRPEPQRVWRHTFGAERRSPSRANFDIAKLDADIVLLQGVRMLAHARLLFPASQWRVVASRQIVQPMLSAAGKSARWGSAARPATTAIAIRYQRRLRVMGVEHLADVVAPAVAASGTTDAASETPAAVALRLRIDGRFVWVVSADLPPSCSGQPGQAAAPDCPARAALELWQATRRPGERVIFGGRNTMHAPSSPSSHIACRAQAIAMIDGAEPPPPAASDAPAAAASALLSQAADRQEAVPPSASPSGHTRKILEASGATRHPLAGCIARMILD